MQPYISLIFYCFIVTVFLYVLWQCVFRPIRKRQKDRIDKYMEVMKESETKTFSESSLDEIPLYNDETKE